jgi:AcrR family transcriptional regulator
MAKLALKGFARRKKRAEERRSSITKAAILVLGQKGYEQTTMQDIADAADLAPSSVYYYFDNKIAILEEALKALTEEIAREPDSNDASKNNSSDSMEQFIDQMNYFKEINLISILAEAEHHPDLHPRILSLMQSLQLEIKRRMQERQEKQILSNIDANAAANLILSAGIGALILSHIKPGNDSAAVSTEVVLNTLNTLFLSNSKNLSAQETA